MDYQTGLFSGGVTGVIVSCVYIVYKLKVHKRCISNCCGRKIELGLQVDNNTPLIEKEIGA